MKKKHRIVLGAAAVLILILGAMLFYLTSYAEAMQEALYAMKSDDKVEVIDGKTILFKPKTMTTKTALIIYPGGKVDPKAYAPLARGIAEQGVQAVIVKMPFNLAIFGANRAMKVIEQNKDIENWYISGHSLGGVMAARFAKSHEADIDGLIFWAAYPEKASDLSASSLPIMSIYGSEDGMTTPGKISDTMHLLPSSTMWVSITGGNHSQFGWYGFQKGDNQAKITRDEQQKEIMEATMQLIHTKADK